MDEFEFDGAMEIARSMVTCVLADQPEMAINLVKNSSGSVNMLNVMLALAAMSASCVETMAARMGEKPMAVWQDSIITMMNDRAG